MASDEMLSWLRTTIEGDRAAAEAAGSQEWVLGKEGQQLYLAPANADPEPWHAEWIAEWTYVVDHCCHPERWDECDTAKQEHIALHDPRDTIARCEAELSVLDRVLPEVRRVAVRLAEEFGGIWPDGKLTSSETMLLKTLASGYRYREGFKSEWMAE